jgi:hypothetical protein
MYAEISYRVATKNMHTGSDRSKSTLIVWKVHKAKVTWKYSGYVNGFPDVPKACDLTYKEVK